MRGTVDPNSLQFDPEIERTARRLRRERRLASQAQDMAEEVPHQRRTLGDYATPSPEGCSTSITRPPIQANNFELKPSLHQLVQQDQFSGGALDDPNLHIANFLQLCDSIKINGASEDAIRLRLFPFSLRDRAKQWLQSQPQGSITTWDGLVHKFLTKYFPPQKLAKLRNEINTFIQKDGESLYDAWERFKDLLRRCPHHSIPLWLQIQTFCDGLQPPIRSMVDAASGGALTSKTPEEALQLIETMAANNYLSPSDRLSGKRGVMELETYDAILAQNKSLSQQLATISKQLGQIQVGAVSSQPLVCDFCGGEHGNGECEANATTQPSVEQVNSMGNFSRQQNNAFSNTYNPGWRNHPNLSWSNQGAQQRSAPWEAALDKLSQSTTTFM